MDDNRIDKAAAFDTLFTNNRIQILKTLAYYIDPHLLKGLAVYIKFLELQYTLALFRKHPETALHSFPLSSDGSSLAGELCSDLMPLCDETQKASLQQVTQMLDNIHNFQEMMDMAKSMQELFPEGFSGYVVRTFRSHSKSIRRSTKWIIPRLPSGCRMIL